MNILVDADACPVKDIIIEIAKRFNIPVYMVYSVSHQSVYEKSVQAIMVDNTPEAVDMAIINRMEKGDIVITQDYGLASIVLTKGGIALHHTGNQYTDQNIDSLLHRRYISAKIRRSGGKIKGPKAFTQTEKRSFKKALIQLIETS